MSKHNLYIDISQSSGGHYPHVADSCKLEDRSPGRQQQEFQSMPKIIVPFLPKARLLQFLQTQCQADADDEPGPFNSALDLDVSHISAHAAVERVTITDLEIEPNGMLVSYDVHYRIFNGCAGVDIRSYLDKKVFGSKGAEGWEFEDFAMPVERSTEDEL